MGVGHIGGALARWLESQGHRVVKFDPPQGLGSVEALGEAEIVFVCVPTPFDAVTGTFDPSYVDDAVAAIPGEKTVVIRSTVLPGTTLRLQREHANHRFLFNPEFLRQKTADEDMRNPDRQILGTTPKSEGDADRVFAVLPDAPVKEQMAATEAETVKYFGNAFLATKVIFAEQMHDLCRALGVDYDRVKRLAAADPRIGGSHLDVACDGYRGYGGACFPKDVRALISLGDALGADLGLLKTVERINGELRGE